MSEGMDRKKLWAILSYSCALIGLLTWAPNLITGFGYGYWLLTFIINPIGVIFGILAKNKLAIILNIITTFSVFIVYILGYLFIAISH